MSNVVDFPPHRRTTSTPARTPARPHRVGPAVYTVAEVAELLSLSTGTTYALVRSGEIPARKVGNRWVIPRQRFHDWLNDLPTTDDDVPAYDSERDPY